ncbi:MAG: hypothetical protein MPK62_13350, partial [Alphaproteobacteria bacterium]|nr:hypothetical protein [Alphaproteobacteria bacterium]
MSIVTLRSTEGPGNDSTKPVNWTNNFKDPIYFNKDDKIQITSVTCNQKVSNFEVGGQGENGTFTHMEGPATGATTDDPFFFRKIAQVPPGTYSPSAMAAAMQGTLNESNLLQVYDFTVDYDDITDPNNPEFD